jgi:3-hydroxyacyl-CoA dehydrogenase / enoyl-CoA hydratase / 3-hydroxybutyryl-CoA epimerase
MAETKNDAVVGTYDAELNIATLSLQMEGSANKINATLLDGLADAMAWAADQEGLAGIILTTGHKNFCVGADLDMVMNERDPASVLVGTLKMNKLLRRLETGVPVVAVLVGSALGGGMEIALATHHRIAVPHRTARYGQPEVSIGLIPGGGATQRLPRLIGLQPALEMCMQGNMLHASKAASLGMLNQVCETREEAMDAARSFIVANPKAKQPWDKRGFVWPGGIQPGSRESRNLFLAATAMLYKKTVGCFPAAEAVISAVHEGAKLKFDRALEVEARLFAGLLVSDQAKDMIRTLFFHREAAEKQVGLPTAAEHGFTKVAVLGAGMMGAGLAYLIAKRGIEVVLRDISGDAVERGLATVRKLVAKRDRRLDAAAQAAILERITPTVELGPVAGCDLVIEAVFESRDLKHKVIAEVEPLLAAGAVFASNTSAIPITDLAKASGAPERFIGLHFFSPVEQMPLLEVICGEATDEHTLGRCLAFARDLRKTVIVVNDGYGFYTSRTFSAYLLEGVQLVAEGYDPATVEWAARSVGMVVAPLQVFDEVSLSLGRKGLEQAAHYGKASDLAAIDLIRRMVDDHDRMGKASGSGFYDYLNGRRLGIWPGLADLVPESGRAGDVATLGRRLILAEVAEVARCLDEGILRSYRDAEVGAIFGIGFAPNTGGPLAFMDRVGLPELVAELDALAEAHGDRFRPAPVLRKMAAAGERFFAEGIPA